MMDFWKTQYRKNDLDSASTKDSDTHDSKDLEQTYWLLVSPTFYQILPGINLYLCVNKTGQVALIGLPDMSISRTISKELHKHTVPGELLVQQLSAQRDSSFLVPVGLSERHKSIVSEIVTAINNEGLEIVLKKYDWQEFFKEIISDNSDYITNDEYQIVVKRFEIIDRSSYKKPESIIAQPYININIPVYLYTDLDKKREFNSIELDREIYVRNSLCETNFQSVKDGIKLSPYLSQLHEKDPLLHVINRAEIEIRLYLGVKPSMADVYMDPNIFEFVQGPPPKLRLINPNDKAYEALKNISVYRSIITWADPNIIQIVLHAVSYKGQNPKKSAVNPSVTIYRDEIGIHVLPAKLYLCPANSLCVPHNNTEEPIYLDQLIASQIPDACLKTVSPQDNLECCKSD
jgi:hypothetical protein